MVSCGNDPHITNGMQTPEVPSRGRTTAKQHQIQHIWMITGPAGCGKTTVARYLASHFKFPYIEGDEFHTPDNIQKMSSGVALTDADRWDWLILLRQKALVALSAGAPGVVVTCSALKRKYRDVVRVAAYYDPNIRVHIVYLSATEELLLKRVKERQGHYMKDDMVLSQWRSLEPPAEDEWDAISVDASGTQEVVNRKALEQVESVIEGVMAKEHDATWS